MKTRETQITEKRIEDLTLRELDMIYSLTRIGDLPASEIGRRYKVSQDDVGRVFENYIELRNVAKSKSDEGLLQNLPPGLSKKPRKRRRDARYGSSRERQAAYRKRLRERRRAGLQQQSAELVTDFPSPVGEEISVANGYVS